MYRFDPNLARAHTLPARWYLDADLLALERRRIFGRTWQLAGRADQVERPGDFLTTTLGHEPLVIARGSDSTLRAFSNVCRHRAGPVALGCGNRKSLQCAYHGWTYGLDGSLLTTPEFDQVENFDRRAHPLPPGQAGTLGPLLFACPDATAPTLAEWLGDIPKETEPLGFERMRWVKRVEYQIECNWKVYVDNYLEGYHIPIVHPGLYKQIDYARYSVDTFRYYSRQDSPIRVTDTPYRRNLGEGENPQALYYWIFPNLMFNLYPDNLQTNLIVPIGPEKTLTIFDWFFLDADRPSIDRDFAQSFAFSDPIQSEDIAICEAVQRGLRSSRYEAGRYSKKRENGVHHFHGLVAEFLGEVAS